jgi:hypothetical protein
MTELHQSIGQILLSIGQLFYLETVLLRIYLY